MVVCKYFLQGNCRFGANCRYDHPGATAGGGGGGGGFGSNQNRFGGQSGSNRFGGGNSNTRKDIWQFNPDDIPNDLGAGKGRPKWVLSSYGPGKNAPASLLQDNEFSSEEVRARFYELAAQGKQDEADREAIALWGKAEQDMNQIVSNARDVEKFMQQAEKQHPNRDDFTQVDGTKTKEEVIKAAEESSSTNRSGGFGSNTSSNPFGAKTTSAFGQPSQPSSGFGALPLSKPAFGQSGFGGGSPSGGAFGQGSSGGGFGSNAPSGGFGKPAFGQSGSGFGSSAFGQPPQPTSAFGQPSQPSSAFGKPSTPVSAFGQPSQPASGFGQPAFGSSGFGSNAPKNPFAPASASGGFGSNPSSAFGKSSQPTSAFGQVSQPSSGFGQPSQPSSGFGQPSQPSPGFGQPGQPSSAFGQPSQPSSAFGQPSQPSVFGQPSQPSSAFGKPPLTGFGQPSTSQSTFGQPQQPSSGFSSNAPSGFGTSTAPASGQPSAPTNPFGVKNAEDPVIIDESMDAPTPVGSRPQSRANPFGVVPSPATAPAPAPMIAPQPTRPMSNTNSSTTAHPLTGRPPHALHYTESLPLGPTQKNAVGKLTTYRGQPVTYVDNTPCYRRHDDRQLEKIWFPDGATDPNVQALNKPEKVQDCQGEQAEYTEDVLEQFRHLFEQGTWMGGKMPLVPPLRQWEIYDF